MAGAALTADGRAQAGMGVAAADYDRDGWLDIAKTNFDDDTTSLYRNLGDGAFEESSVPAGLGANNQYLGWGIGFPDFDLDGWPDLLTVNGHVYPEADRAGGRYAYAQRKVLYRNLGERPLRGRVPGGRSRHRAPQGRPRRRLRRPLQPRTRGRRREQHERRADPAPRLRARGGTGRWS